MKRLTILTATMILVPLFVTSCHHKKSDDQTAGNRLLDGPTAPVAPEQPAPTPTPTPPAAPVVTGIFGFDSSNSSSESESGQTVNLFVNRTGGSSGAITIPIIYPLNVEAGFVTASQPVDYTGPTEIKFADGETRKAIQLIIVRKTIPNSKRIYVDLGTPTPGGSLVTDGLANWLVRIFALQVN